ncbi:GntR family transcriptional regulator [Pusillimonas sp. T2]|uniref:GntR family transcriptional regulator n=1 Tax=Pusillimonas sp. T2 TaxID=1548123 RepID=UPI00117A84EF|nr:GntR family transcriptional regulator [Pusillimonas sp. T2]
MATKKVPSDKTRVRKAPSLTEQAYTLIKDKILSLELRPGLFLNEAALCAMTGFGRMPVHQAIQRLRMEGLIEVIPRKGLVVRFDSLHDILELIEARLTMEPEVVALAAQRVTPEQIEELRGLLVRSKALTSQTKRDEFSQIDHAFHSLIALAAGNKFLADAQRPLHDRSNMMWHLRVMPDDGLVVTQREHEAILEAIIKQDAQAAREAMRAHLMSLQKRILKASV